MTYKSINWEIYGTIWRELIFEPKMEMIRLNYEYPWAYFYSSTFERPEI